MNDVAAQAAKLIAGARTGRQLRSAIGVTLVELSSAYGLLGQIGYFSGRSAKSTRALLDSLRMELEALYKRLSDLPQPPAGDVGKNTRTALARTWNEITGLRAELAAFAGWRGADILGQAIAEAPATLLAATQKTLETAGDAASGLAGSALRGFWPLLIVIALLALAQLGARRRGLL